MTKNWFEELFGFVESDRTTIISELAVEGNRLRSIRHGTQWACGRLDIISLSDLLNQSSQIASAGPKIKVSEVIGDAKSLHADPANAGALFQWHLNSICSRWCRPP